MVSARAIAEAQRRASARGAARRRMLGIYQALVHPLACRVAGLVRRAIVSGGSGDASSVTVTAKPLDGPSSEVHQAAEAVMPPGFTAVPVDGSEALLLCEGGDTGHPIVIVSASKRLPGVAKGEASIHVDNVLTGARVIVRNDGMIEVQPGVGGVVRLGAAAPAPAPAVSRVGDATLVNATDTSTINQLVSAWNATQPAGGAINATPNRMLTPVTLTGTITSGGTGSVST